MESKLNCIYKKAHMLKTQPQIGGLGGFSPRRFLEQHINYAFWYTLRRK